jgi:DNA-binding transcriptional LysR family regulator
MADRRLQVFYSVARLLSFTKAAEALHMTQPAVTFQVRQLEDHFNTRLFDRTHNRISLTEAGRGVMEYAERIFAVYNEMESAVRQITGNVSGVLTLGASTTVAEYMLPVLLGDFKAQYPDVRLQLRVSNTEGIVSWIEHSEIDLGIVEAAVTNKNLLVEICRMDQLVAIIPPQHPLATKSAIRVQELLEYPFICREEGSGTREVITEYLGYCGVCAANLLIGMELGSPEAVKGAVEAGLGVSIVSRVTIAKELRLGTLVALPLDPPLQRPFAFVRQKQKFRQASMERLLEFAKSYCATHD